MESARAEAVRDGSVQQDLRDLCARRASLLGPDRVATLRGLQSYETWRFIQSWELYCTLFGWQKFPKI